MQMKVNAFVQFVLRPVRFFMIAFTCSLLFLSSTFPAFAIDSYQSDPREGTTQLLEIQRKTDEVAKSAPPGLSKVQKESNEGLNEVQGSADYEKQKRPENSQNATSVEENVKQFLEKVTGNN
jgi:flagellar motility protein MotE (MotC chaperone)